MTIDKNNPINVDIIRQHPSVQEFLQRVIDRLYTSEDALAIEAELVDHIYSLSEDYLSAGHTQETAIRKALLQMGDPSEIGYSFTDFDAMRRRKYMRVGLKWAAALILVTTLALLILLTEGSQNGTSISNSEDNDSYLFIILNLINCGMTFMNITRLRSKRMGISTNKLKISQMPLLILWPYKRRFQWEYVVVALFFVPLLAIFPFLIAYEGDSPILFFSFFSAVLLSIGLFFYSERFRVPKYMVLEEGLIIRNQLISWTSIDRMRWSSDYLGNSQHFILTLEFNTVKTNKDKAPHNSLTAKVYVNSKQYRQVNAILKEYIG